MRKRILSNFHVHLVLAVSVLTAFVLTGPQVMAHTTDSYGGSWASPTTIRSQVFTSANPWYSFVSHGFNAWNYTTSSSKLWMQELYYTSNDADVGYQIRVRGVALGANGAYADTQNYKRTTFGYAACYNGDQDVCGNVTYAYSMIRINTDNFGTTGTDMNRRSAMTHEYGHSLGLKHPSHATDTAIMTQGQWSFDVPAAHDIEIIKAKYGQ